MWKYESPIGTMFIKFVNGKYGLFFNDELYGTWHSPSAAADDVYHHITGCEEWDSLDGLLPYEPSDLSEWEEF